MKNEKALEIVKNNFIPVAKSIVASGKQHAPMFIVSKNGSFVPTIIPMRNETEKQQSADMMYQICKKSNADFMILITEAWYVIRKEVGNVIPSKCDDRKECIHIIINFKKGKNISYTIPIIRSKDKTTFGKMKEFSQSMDGKFIFTW